jgi:hypothetical protein
MNLAALGVGAESYRAGWTAINGRYVVAPQVGNVSLLADVAAAGITGAGTSLAPVQQALASTDGTLIEPIAAALSSAVGRGWAVRSTRAARSASSTAADIRRFGLRDVQARRPQRCQARSKRRRRDLLTIGPWGGPASRVTLR